MKLIRYLATWFHIGNSGQSEPKFVAGQCYPVTDETTSHVAQGVAEEVDAPEDAEKAEAKADTAEAKAAAAVAAAAAARDAADLAAAAQTVADSPAPDAPAAADTTQA